MSRAQNENPTDPHRGFRRWLKPKPVREWTAIWKERGLRGLLKEKGWKIVAGLFVFYLIRDTVLYVIVPFWVARGFLGC